MAEPEFEERSEAAFKAVLGQFATGVTVVTALAPSADLGARGPVEEEPVGLTCQAFSSVSLHPPLVLFVPSRTSRAWPGVERAGAFCVNVLGEHQVALSERMAGPGPDKFAGLAWERSAVTGSPVLPGCLAYLDCTLEAVHDGGDHAIVVGRVVDLAVGVDASPLLYHRGRYRGLG